jgi:predicted Zn-dependent protease
MPPRAMARVGRAGHAAGGRRGDHRRSGRRQRGAGLIDFAAQGGAALIGLRFSREHELEADHYGIDYMVRAGYDPKAAVELQETFVRLSGNKSSNWLAGMFATHPPSQERVDANRRKAAAGLPAGCFAARRPTGRRSPS